ncbi:MAG: polysaccharide biosynthesis/export family protein [Acidobacteriota bacterium]
MNKNSAHSVPTKGLRFACFVLAATLVLIPHVYGQELTMQTANSPIVRKDADVIRDADDQYLIGVGDVLDVRIFNRPLLSRDAVRVDGRNMIRLPLIGEVRAGCMTESALAESISQHYLEYLKNPNVEVFIKDYQSKPVMVIGAVREPGQFQMHRRVRLLELISLAGGLTDAADGRMQVKHSVEIPTCSAGVTHVENALKSADPEVEWFDVGELLKTGASSKNSPYVQPGDTINLLEADKVFVVGNVVKPSIIPLKEKVTISKAIAASGGTLPDSKLDKVRILRQTGQDAAEKTEILVDLKAINKREAEDVALIANDIVDVPTSSGKKFLRGLMNSIAPTVSRGAVRVIP